MKGGILCERSRRDERKLTDSDVSSRARGSEYHYFHWPSDRDRKEPDFKKRRLAARANQFKRGGQPKKSIFSNILCLTCIL